MQSVVKRSEVGNIYKLSDHANADQDASSDYSGDIQKKPAAAVLSNKDGGALGNPNPLEVSDDKPAAEKPAAIRNPAQTMLWRGSRLSRTQPEI